MTVDGERLLIEAIGNKTARTVAARLVEEGGPGAPLAQRVLDATDAILARVTREAEWLGSSPQLRGANLQVDPSGQLHHITGSLASWSDAAPAVRRLRQAGWVSWHDLEGSSEVALYKAVEQVTLARLENEPITLELTWDDAPFMRVAPILRPTLRDIGVVALPKKLAPLYSLVRPVRLLAERTGRLAQRNRSLGPILSTPRELIAALLELAQVGPDDHLVDLGCGEGRVVVEASHITGCRVTGVETDERLVKRARANIADELGADAQATVVHADAATFDLGDATVVFLFIPAEAIGEVVSQIRGKGFTGKIVSHEQATLAPGAVPVESRVLATAGALTVAHLW